MTAKTAQITEERKPVVLRNGDMHAVISVGVKPTLWQLTTEASLEEILSEAWFDLMAATMSTDDLVWATYGLGVFDRELEATERQWYVGGGQRHSHIFLTVTAKKMVDRKRDLKVWRVWLEPMMASLPPLPVPPPRAA
ncbi:MAG: hypothetical protein H6842_04640 [Rhodospirillaceae bacterium]|nr:hypothetical protein [Rhodospirillaceae bacterium]